MYGRALFVLYVCKKVHSISLDKVEHIKTLNTVDLAHSLYTVCIRLYNYSKWKN